MRKTLGITGRILVTVFMLAWWTAGLVFLYSSPGSLVYIVPLEIVGIILCWTASDPDRLF